MKNEGIKLGVVLAVMLVVCMAFVPAVSAKVETNNRTVLDYPLIQKELNKLSNTQCEACNGMLLVERNGYAIYKTKVDKDTYLIRINEYIAENGSVSGNVQYVSLPAKKADITANDITQSEVDTLAWNDILVRYEIFTDSLDSCLLGTHHYLGITFELEDRAGAWSEAVLMAVLCTLLTKHPGIGLGCGIAAATIGIYWEHEKIFTMGSYDYDYAYLPWSADGIALGWHSSASDLLKTFIMPGHRYTW